MVDALRGATIISMVLFHFCYDMFIIFGRNPQWYDAASVHIWQQSICWSFIFISGFVWPLAVSRNLRRGLMLNVYGLLISAVTYIAVPDEAIWFGVLNFLGCAVLLMLPLDKAAKRLPPLLGLISSFLLFLLCYNVPEGCIGFEGLRLELPKILYSIKVLTPLGFPYPGFKSSDFFPLLPWFFLYLCGYFFYGVFSKHETWRSAASVRIPAISEIGRKSLWIYLLHQPLAMLVCMLIFR